MNSGATLSTGLRLARRFAAVLALTFGLVSHSAAQNPFLPPSAAGAATPPVGGTAVSPNVSLERVRALAGAPAAAPRAADLAAPAPPGGEITRIVRPRTRVLAGSRVFDPISGDLLDDVQVLMLDQSELGDYFDDGTHGDRIKDDGEFANVTIETEFIGARNQRLKERTIKAVVTAEGLDPLEFYGYNILTMQRHQDPPRKERWTFVPNPSGGPGKKLVEKYDPDPPKMERYQDKIEERDTKIEEWAVSFLNDYRVNKGEINSDFYQVYIPRPPVPPSIVPPTDAGWIPFPNPAGPEPEALVEGVPGLPAGLPQGLPAGVSPNMLQNLPRLPAGAAGSYYDEEMISRFLNR